MEFIINKALTDKLKNIKSIGVSVDDGLIMGIDKKDKLIPLSQEIIELVCISLMDRKKTILSSCDVTYKISVDKILNK